jgi:hypothetical protein
MRTTLVAAAIAGIIGSAASVGFGQAKPTGTLPIKGVWKRVSTVTTGATPSNVTNWSPNVYIYTDRHYSHIFESDGMRRPPLAPPKDPNKLTDAEKLAQREAWAPFTANGGTYEVKGNSVIHHQMVSKVPAPAAGYAAETLAGFESVKIEGNTMVRTAKTADGKGVVTTTFMRVE